MDNEQMNIDLDLRAELSGRLKKVVKWTGKTYKQMGEDLKLSPTRISDILNVKSVPSVKTIYKIAEYCGLNTFGEIYDELIDGLEMLIKTNKYILEQGKLNNLFAMSDYKKALRDEYELYQRRNKKKSSILLRETKNSIIVADDGMNAVGIRKGLKVDYSDYVDDAKNGEIYVIHIGERVLIRRYYRLNERIALVPASTIPDFPIEDFSISEVKIIGTVRSIYFNQS